MDKCNNEVYDKGEVVFITHTIKSNNIELWVRKIAADSDQPVDWHWYAGRAAIKALGNLDKVKTAIKNNRDLHDHFMSEALEQFEHCKGRTDENNRMIQGIWDYNNL